MAREAVAGEDTVCGECCAAVGVAVADIDVGLAGKASTLARLAAGRARRLVAEANAPAVRSRVDAVREHLQLDAFPLEHGLDQLMEARGDHERTVAVGQLVQTSPDVD